MKVSTSLLTTGFFALVALIAAMTGFYTIDPDEEAVIIRLGKYSGTYQPGAHFKIPFGVDKLYKVKTTKIHQEEFGFRTRSVNYSQTRYSEKNFDHESLMLTGDLNVADVEWVVQYKIADPYKFCFRPKTQCKIFEMFQNLLCEEWWGINWLVPF